MIIKAKCVNGKGGIKMKLFRTYKWVDAERGYGDAGTVEILSGTKEKVEGYLVKKYERCWWMYVGLEEITLAQAEIIVDELIEQKNLINEMIEDAEVEIEAYLYTKESE